MAHVETRVHIYAVKPGVLNEPTWEFCAVCGCSKSFIEHMEWQGECRGPSSGDEPLVERLEKAARSSPGYFGILREAAEYLAHVLKDNDRLGDQGAALIGEVERLTAELARLAPTRAIEGDNGT